VLVLRLADHVKLMLAVDRVLLSQAKFIADSWLKFDFPDPLSFLFDAVYYDESEKNGYCAWTRQSILRRCRGD